VLGNQGLHAHYDKLGFVGGTGDLRVNYARTDVIPGGLKKPADIAKTTHLYEGDSGATGVSGLLAHLALDVLGVPNQLISGYRGGADVFLAMQRGEIQFHNASITAFRGRNGEFIRSGKGMGINYFVPVAPDGSYERNPLITEMPAYPDLYKEVHGKMPAGAEWDALNWLAKQTGEMTFVGLAPPGTPPDVLAMLRRGYEDASNDPDMIKQSIAMNGLPYSFVGAQRGRDVLLSLAEVTPEVLGTLRKTIESGRR
jgi:hypothetical protein